MNDTFLKSLATQGVVGYGQAPGTTATIMMIPCIWLIGSWEMPMWAYASTVTLFLIVSWYIIRLVLPLFEDADPSAIVLDEMIGFMVVFIAIPVTIKTILVGFIFFRLFDIYKCFGAYYIEKIGGASGVLLDDVYAACLANSILRLLLYMHLI